MKFVVHDHYNNSRNPSGKFDCLPRAEEYSDALVEITDQGIAFLTTAKRHNVKKRVAFLKEVNALLKKEFGHGVDAVTSADADCVVAREVDVFFRAAKELGAKTIALDYEKISFIGMSDEATNADHKLGPYFPPKDLIAAIAPTAEDRAEPQRGWESFKTQLNAIYEKALERAAP
jgi:hypothetical protein